MLLRAGFTLIELMIVIAIIAVLVAIAIPNLLAAKTQANETQAIGTLRAITSAQSQFHVTSRIDFDSDATGQFGFFRELSGAVGLRAAPDWSQSTAPLSPPILAGAFRTLTPNGEAQRSGYMFRMFLPDTAGTGVPEPATLGLPVPTDEDLSEVFWCAYAYPSDYGKSALRSFFVNQAGLTSATDDPAYSGSGSFNAGTAGRAFIGPAGTGLGSMTGLQAVGTVARDGNMWTSVQ